MKRLAVTCALVAMLRTLACRADSPVPVQDAGKPPLEAIQRQDPTGQGSFHREGHLRREGEAVEKLDKLDAAATNKVAVTHAPAAVQGSAKKGDTK